MRWTVADIPDQSGRVAIVTGSNTGIGFEAARILAGKGARVVLACRNESKAENAVGRIRAFFSDADVTHQMLDLANLVSVRAFADEFKGHHDRLDLLINNAGLMVPPFGHTADGFELQFGTNHLGHFALTGLLLDQLNETQDARVVTLSSLAHRFGKIDFDDPNSEKSYSAARAYCQSKLACLLFAEELQRRLEKINSGTLSLAAHPGGTATDLQRHSRFAKILVPLIAQETAAGAMPTVRAATDPAAQGGDYYGPDGFLAIQGDPVKEQPAKRALDAPTAARLWKLSEELTDVHYLS